MTYTWLDGFVESVGLEAAEILLRDTGIPRTFRNKNSSDWALDTSREEIAMTAKTHNSKLLAYMQRRNIKEENELKLSKNAPVGGGPHVT